MKAPAIIMCLLLCGLLHAEEASNDEILSFQSFAPWSPRINLNADVAMVYGIDPTLPERIESWRKHGYHIHVMTGISWGHYHDFIDGRFDGKKHEDQQQTEKNGKPIVHSGDICYMCPDEAYGRFLCVGVNRALDAGATAIHLEEPEFWVKGGYSEGFKREWQAYYKEEWQAPDSSPDAQYRASKLKYYLYRRALSQVFDFVRNYGKEAGREIRCYVPTHSLLNYAHWRIVSPESSLLDVGCDGYIAQVWTGTARTSNVYEGRRKERTFETAFLEYGAMQNLVRASGRRVWYLNDPIEDNPDHSWKDYRANWESTLTASLLQPEVWRYEIMPWPDRIFGADKTYPVKERSQRKPGEPVEKEVIPKSYETELQIVIRALGEMKQPPEKVRWELSGSRGIGVLVSDTMMFQRGEPNPSDLHLGSFYGLAMPLLKRGIPVDPVQVESAAKPGFLGAYKILLLSYEGQKPPSPAFHDAIAQWVRSGGKLVFIDDDKDPYNTVREWWNTAPHAFQNPRQHLFKTLGIAEDATGAQKCGKGTVVRGAVSPAALTYEAGGAQRIRNFVREAAGQDFSVLESNALVLRRGPYVIAAGLGESIPNEAPPVLKGRWINLFDPALSLLGEVKVSADVRALLLDLSSFAADDCRVAASACRISAQKTSPESFAFKADGIEASEAVVLSVLAKAPQAVSINGKLMPADSWQWADGLLRLHFINSAGGVEVQIKR